MADGLLESAPVLPESYDLLLWWLRTCSAMAFHLVFSHLQGHVESLGNIPVLLLSGDLLLPSCMPITALLKRRRITNSTVPSSFRLQRYVNAVKRDSRSPAEENSIRLLCFALLCFAFLQHWNPISSTPRPFELQPHIVAVSEGKMFSAASSPRTSKRSHQ